MTTAALPATSGLSSIAPGIEAANQMPTYGRTNEEQQLTLDAAEAGTEALAHRYDNPNWFNVAAGFFKPQLGGFAASLGSAGQALGENLEQQRANAVPTYVARSQVALMKARQEQRVKANAMLEKHIAEHPNDALPSALMSTITATAPGSEAETGAAAFNVERTRAANEASTLAGTNVAQANAALNNTLYKPLADPFSGVKIDPSVQKTALIANIAKAPGVDADALANQPLDTLQAMSYAYDKSNLNSALTDKTAADKVLEGAQSDIKGFAQARTIIDKPKIEAVLGTVAGQNAMSALAAWAKSGSADGGRAFNTAIAQLKSDPETFNDFQVLSKVLMNNLAATRNAMQNPSVSSQELAALSSPDITAQTAPAMRKIIDLLAHERSSEGQLAAYRLGYGGKTIDISKDAGFQNLQNNLAEQSKQIATDKATPGVAPYYNLFSALKDNTAPKTPVDKDKLQYSPASSATAPTAKPSVKSRKNYSMQDYMDAAGIKP